MTYEYRDFYGSKAYIFSVPGGWKLKVYAKGYGDYWITKSKVYETFRGARIAMGMLGDGWMQVCDPKEEVEHNVVLRG